MGSCYLCLQSFSEMLTEQSQTRHFYIPLKNFLEKVGYSFRYFFLLTHNYLILQNYIAVMQKYS